MTRTDRCRFVLSEMQISDSEDEKEEDGKEREVLQNHMEWVGVGTADPFYFY